MRLLLVVGLIATSLTASAISDAEERIPRPNRGVAVEVPTHDGFYFSAKLGGGWVSSATSSQSVSLSGSGGMATLAIGGAFARDLIFHVELLSCAAPEQSGEGDGSDRGVKTAASTQVTGFGPGFTYYVMPQNLFVSVSLLVPRLRVRSLVGDVVTDFGLGGSLAVGKEWWVSEEWGVGIAGQFVPALANAAQTKWVGAALMLSLSATYN